MMYLGIDPGVGGALAALNEEGDTWVWDTPVVQVKKRRKQVPALVASLLNPLPDIHFFATLEEVHSMPRDSAVGAFTFGRSLGGWEQGLASARIPYQMVSPQRWMALICGSKRDPGARIEAAIRLFPAMAENLQRKKDGGRADALLLAEYSRRTYKP